MDRRPPLRHCMYRYHEGHRWYITLFGVNIHFTNITRKLIFCTLYPYKYTLEDNKWLDANNA